MQSKVPSTMQTADALPSSDIPAVTVLMPVLNAEAHLREAVDSIRAQTLRHWELIVVDAGSSDRTVGILESYADPRIKVHVLAGAPLVEQLNHGLHAARSALIARMDADDIAAPARLEQQHAVLQADERIGVVGSSFYLADEIGKRLSLRPLPERHEDISRLLPLFCVFCHGATMYRKSVVLSIGGYRAEAFPAEDYDLWVRLLGSTMFQNIGAPLLDYRVSEHGISRVQSALQRRKHLEISTGCIESMRDRLPPGDPARAGFEIDLARAQYYHGSMRDARKILLRILSMSPFRALAWRFLLPGLLGDRVITALRRREIPQRIKGILRLGKNWGDALAP